MAFLEKRIGYSANWIIQFLEKHNIKNTYVRMI